MGRSVTSPSRRPRGSRRRVAPARLLGPGAELVVVPDADRRLGDGVVVRATVLARVLGFKLLRLEADVVLAPAELRATALPHPAVGGVDGDRPDVVRGPPLERRRPPHGRLADATRMLGEADASLARAR